MALTEQEQFRFDMLSRFVQLGLTPTEVQGRVKAATQLVKQAFGVSGLLSLLATAPLQATGYGLAGSAALGGLAGHLAGRVTDQDIDPEEARRQELIGVYAQQAERARRNAARIRYRQQNAKPAAPKLY